MTDAGHGDSIVPPAAGSSDGCHGSIYLYDGSRCSLPKTVLHGRLSRLGANYVSFMADSIVLYWYIEG